MKTMLKFLGVTAIIAASNAVFIEYSENAFIKNNAPHTGPMTAKAINSDREFKFFFHKDDLFKQDVFLELDELPDPAQGDGQSICGNDLGIHITDVGTFCHPSFFQVGIGCLREKSEDGEASTSKDTNEDGELLQFALHFKSAKTQECLLGIPIYQLPPKIDSSNPDKLKTWAKENQVGLLSPNDIQKLSAVRRNQGLTTNFIWLSDLLKHGVFKIIDDDSEDQSTDIRMPVFISRPIVLSEKDVHELKAWISAVHKP